MGTIYQSPVIESNGAMDIVYKLVTTGETGYGDEKYICMDLPMVTADNVDEYEPAY